MACDLLFTRKLVLNSARECRIRLKLYTFALLFELQEALCEAN